MLAKPKRNSKMNYIAPNQVTAEHLAMLEKSYAASPMHERLNILQIMKLLETNEVKLFEVPHGVVLAEVRKGNGTRRLSIPGFYCSMYGAHARGIVAGLKRLAKSWQCTEIETCVYSRSLMQIILKLGGRVESVNLVMEVDHGHENKDEILNQRNEDGGSPELDYAGDQQRGGTGNERSRKFTDRLLHWATNSAS